MVGKRVIRYRTLIHKRRIFQTRAISKGNAYEKEYFIVDCGRGRGLHVLSYPCTSLHLAIKRNLCSLDHFGYAVCDAIGRLAALTDCAATDRNHKRCDYPVRWCEYE